MSNDVKMNPDEAAAYLDIAAPTLLKWRAKDIGPPFYKPNGKNIYYFKSDLDVWIRCATVKGESDE